MHNCKTTRERLTELLLDDIDPRAVLAAELRECAECREESVELSDSLRVTRRLIETATPPESYWPGYHARLKERLRAAQQPRVEPGQYQPDRRPWLTRIFFSSIRVPVPIGLALIFVLGFLFFKVRVPTGEVSIVHVPIEVPVIQEKPVERIVYRERPSRPSRRSRRTHVPVRHDTTVASLEGFKPAEEVKLTVIKGGSGNEK